MTGFFPCIQTGATLSRKKNSRYVFKGSEDNSCWKGPQEVSGSNSVQLRDHSMMVKAMYHLVLSHFGHSPPFTGHAVINKAQDTVGQLCCWSNQQAHVRLAVCHSLQVPLSRAALQPRHPQPESLQGHPRCRIWHVSLNFRWLFS